MQLWNLAAILLPLALPGASPAAAHAPAAEHDLAANAALKYWQAFDQLPAPDEGRERLIEEWDRVPLDAAALKLLAASEKSLMYLHRGAKLRRCDWSLDYEDGPGLLMPHLAKARTLARLAALHARLEFEQGRPEEGLEDATAILALAGHVGADPILICTLVGHSLERVAIKLLSSHLPELKEYFPKITSAHGAWPSGAAFPAVFRAEKEHMIEWLIKEFGEAERREEGSWRDVWKSVLPGEDGQDALEQVGSLERAIQLLKALLPVYDHLERVVALPREEFDRQYPGFYKKTKVDNPLAGVILPAVDRVLAAEHRNMAEWAMLEAAMAVIRGGPGKLQDVKDPFGDGPFEYRALDGGFELKSDLMYNAQPVTLTIGRGAKR